MNSVGILVDGEACSKDEGEGEDEDDKAVTIVVPVWLDECMNKAYFEHQKDGIGENARSLFPDSEK